MGNYTKADMQKTWERFARLTIKENSFEHYFQVQAKTSISIMTRNFPKVRKKTDKPSPCHVNCTPCIKFSCVQIFGNFTFARIK